MVLDVLVDDPLKGWCGGGAVDLWCLACKYLSEEREYLSEEWGFLSEKSSC
jgi:hypothetical protein